MGSSIFSLDKIITNIIMRTSVIIAFLCMVVMASASQKVRKLEKVELGCSIEEMLACGTEISTAVEHCGHLNTIDEIMTCVNDILGATDCITCICDILGC